MPRFKKKPLIIHAIQWTGNNIHEIWDQFGAAGIYGPTETNPEHLILTTPDGFGTQCRLNEWVVSNSKPDTFHAVDDELMKKKYDRLPEESVVKKGKQSK